MCIFGINSRHFRLSFSKTSNCFSRGYKGATINSLKLCQMNRSGGKISVLSRTYQNIITKSIEASQKWSKLMTKFDKFLPKRTIIVTSLEKSPCCSGRNCFLRWTASRQLLEHQGNFLQLEIQNSCYLPQVCLLFLNNNKIKDILILRAFQDLSDLVNCSSFALGEKQLSPKRYAEGKARHSQIFMFYVQLPHLIISHFTSTPKEKLEWTGNKDNLIVKLSFW